MMADWGIPITRLTVTGRPRSGFEAIVQWRWIATMSQKTDCDLIASTGIHDGRTVFKHLSVASIVIDFTQDMALAHRKGSSLMDIEDFAANVASPDPIIAGGSVAAHVGAFTAALGEMMAGLSEGRQEFAEQYSRIKEIHKELTDSRNLLQNLAAKDSRAFGSVLIARRMPSRTKEEDDARTKEIERAMKDATETPLWNVRTVFRVLELLRTLIEIRNPNARTDAVIGAQLACASLKSAQFNILANSPGLQDRAFAESCLKEAEVIARSAQEIMRQINLLMEASPV